MKENLLRIMRNNELTGCDWTQANDSPLSDSKKAEWATYRQKLRDFPSKVNFNDIVYNNNTHMLENVNWPTKPE